MPMTQNVIHKIAVGLKAGGHRSTRRSWFLLREIELAALRRVLCGNPRLCQLSGPGVPLSLESVHLSESRQTPGCIGVVQKTLSMP